MKSESSNIELSFPEKKEKSYSIYNKKYMTNTKHHFLYYHKLLELEPLGVLENPSPEEPSLHCFLYHPEIPVFHEERILITAINE